MDIQFPFRRNTTRDAIRAAAGQVLRFPMSLLSIRSRSSRSLVWVGAFLIFGSLLTSVGAVWELHIQARDQALQHINTIGALIAEQTASSMQAIDLSLRDIQAIIAARGITTPDALSATAGTPAFHDLLVQRLVAMPQADAITIVAAGGQLVASSRAGPTATALSLSDRDYYVDVQAHPDDTVHISQPLINRATGQRNFFIVRRLQNANGAFLGLVVCAMRLDYFESLYSRIGLAEGAGVTLLRRDGLVLVQFPVAGTSLPVRRIPPDSPWYAAVQTGGGAYFSPGHGRPGSRFISVHPLGAYPAVVDTTIAHADAFAHWWRQATTIAVIALLAMLSILAFFRVLLAQSGRLERQTRDLAAAGAALGESESRLLAKSTLLETTLENMDQGLIMVDASRNIAVYNSKVLDMLDVPPGQLAGNPPFSDLESYQWRRQANSGDVPWTDTATRHHDAFLHPYTYVRHHPHGRDIEVHSVPINGGGFVRTYSDITEREAAETKIRYLAQHDGLTQLSNRAVFRERLEQRLARRPRGANWAVYYLDLDRFKEVNDTLGHAIGDQLLSAAAARLRGCTRDDDIVSRIGGDEFAVMQVGVEQPGDAAQLARRFIATISRPFDVGGKQVAIGISVGIAIGPTDGADADTLLQHADLALYHAKAHERGGFRFFEPSMSAALQDRHMLEADLHQALADGAFELFFQPILDTQSLRLTGFEALIRWRHPQRGLVAPADFIPLAEEIGLIIPIGEWVLAEACRQAVTWPGSLNLAVNLSCVQFQSSNLAAAIGEALAASGLPADRLELEVTESVLMRHTETSRNSLHAMRETGLRIILDDFGTGYSSLSYLRSFPFDGIKIDQSFIRDIDTKDESRAIVRTILDLARTLGMSVTAEGVATGAQFAILREEGCAGVQGFLFSQPRPGADIPELITQLGTWLLQAV